MRMGGFSISCGLAVFRPTPPIVEAGRGSTLTGTVLVRTLQIRNHGVATR